MVDCSARLIWIEIDFRRCLDKAIARCVHDLHLTSISSPYARRGMPWQGEVIEPQLGIKSLDTTGTVRLAFSDL
ncbi:MAG TPA: hypothetical protein VE944_05370 [Nostoc sp.]|uniref:hypothetical protein n=1 Tax=Nostoc sp. TaxID=1180 RepID=UPI002D489FA3|nr:hypothetical protein [Nostoc sp.]HYX13794.1 hypothetical protein [Nostoc sp.]